jgi:hypothetical protein
MGRTNSYRVLPQSVIQQVVDTYEALKTSPVERDGFDDELVPLNGTPQSPGRPAKQDTTSPVERGTTSPVERDTILSLSVPVSIPIDDRVEKVSKPSAKPNPYDVERVTVQDGRVQLHNGLRAEWLDMFGNDEILLNAALKGVTIQKNGYPPETQVSRQLTAVLQRQRPKQSQYPPSAKEIRTSEHTEFMKQIKNIKV